MLLPEIVPDESLVAAGAPFRFRAPDSLLRLLAPLMSFEGAVARLATCESVLASIDRHSAFYKPTLPVDIALDLLDAMPANGPLLIGTIDAHEIHRAAEELFVRHDLALPSHVRVMLLVSRGGRTSEAHYDDVTGINIQLAGRKAWRVSSGKPTVPPHDGELALAGAPEASARGEHERQLGETFVMEPGDGVFLPAGAVHAVDGIEDSVSLQINCRNRDTRFVDALMGVVVKCLLDDPAATVPYAGFGVTTEQSVARGRSILARLEERLADVTGEDLFPAGVDSDGERAAPPSSCARWNPAATLRSDPAGDGRVAISAGIAGTFGETGRLKVREELGSAIMSLRRKGRVDRASLACALGTRDAETLFERFVSLGVIAAAR